MKHLGDITKIHGCAVPIADCVIGGSPCQDLSVAGKREGLAGARSGLFMEQIRIVKEMRYADQCSGRTGQFIRPRYMVWENVPGAFSSNDTEDFRAVLEETARVAYANAAIPRPPKKWANAGCIMGDGWSIAWHVLDAQFWGVPQRRRRIALISDFGGYTAPEILFERDGLCWDSAQGGETGQGIAGGSAGCVSETDSVKCLTPWDCQSKRIFSPDGAWNTLPAMGDGGANNQAVCYGIQQNASGEVRKNKETSYTLNTNGNATGRNAPLVAEPVTYPGVGITSKQNASNAQPGDPCHTLNQDSRNYVCYPQTSYGFKLGNSEQARSIGFQEERSPTPNAECGGNKPAICYDMTRASDVIRECGETAPTIQSRMGTGGNQMPLTFQNTGRGWWNQSDIAECIRTPCGGDSTKANLASGGYAVRRLTPLECERLQGYPDGWTDIGAWADSNGKLHKESSDSARYKALGNSIALPPWKWVLKRLCAFYERDATMASLFDGIGGFPLIWERLNGKGSCLWASEIEEFPIAVTKFRFAKSEETP